MGVELGAPRLTLLAGAPLTLTGPAYPDNRRGDPIPNRAAACRADVSASITRSRESWLQARAILTSAASRQSTRTLQSRHESRRLNRKALNLL